MLLFSSVKFSIQWLKTSTYQYNIYWYVYFCVGICISHHLTVWLHYDCLTSPLLLVTLFPFYIKKDALEKHYEEFFWTKVIFSAKVFYPHYQSLSFLLTAWSDHFFCNQSQLLVLPFFIISTVWIDQKWYVNNTHCYIFAFYFIFYVCLCSHFLFLMGCLSFISIEILYLKCCKYFSWFIIWHTRFVPTLYEIFLLLLGLKTLFLSPCWII